MCIRDRKNTTKLENLLLIGYSPARVARPYQILTLGLNIVAVSYTHLDVYKRQVKDFPPIRVWGTIGFICAMWAVDLTGFKSSCAQLYVGGAAALILGLYSFTLPACPPAKSENKSLLSAFGLDALVLFKRKKMVIFFLFSMSVSYTHLRLYSFIKHGG